jgi:hypothetical protein
VSAARRALLPHVRCGGCQHRDSDERCGRHAAEGWFATGARAHGSGRPFLDDGAPDDLRPTPDPGRRRAGGRPAGRPAREASTGLPRARSVARLGPAASLGG